MHKLGNVSGEDSSLGETVQPPPIFSHYPAIPPPQAIPLTTLPAHVCSYFPERTAQSRAFWAPRLPGTLYQGLMDSGFRRSGTVVYQPVCTRCRACQPIRVPVNRFMADKSQRRCWRQNQEMTVAVAAPRPSDETYDLYVRYVRQWHGRDSEEDSREAFEQFLYSSPVQSLEFQYRNPTGQLLAVGICDVSPEALSSVYFFFDPKESRRSLGTFGALYELEYAKQKDIGYYYLGYWIEGSGTMQYKNRFRPNELLGNDGRWVASEKDGPPTMSS